MNSTVARYHRKIQSKKIGAGLGAENEQHATMPWFYDAPTEPAPTLAERIRPIDGGRGETAAGDNDTTPGGGDHSGPNLMAHGSPTPRSRQLPEWHHPE